MRAKRRSKTKFGFYTLLGLLITLMIIRYFSSHTVAVLEPRGTISSQERHLMIIAVLLCSIVVIPVFLMTIFIVSRYKEGGKKNSKYRPDWDHSPILEFLWWAIPCGIIGVLSVVAWNSSRILDPYRALAASRPTMTIQVIALDWKWLFIYPQQNIASVNLAQFPVNTPVDFEITSDTVMNSFWVPQLGGQIYAMPGMSTHLNLIANQAGSYSGSSANISGQGFAGMTFTARASSQTSFNRWVSSIKQSSPKLSSAQYAKLAKPSQDDPASFYSSPAKDLFDGVVFKYMLPADQVPAAINAHLMPGMSL